MSTKKMSTKDKCQPKTNIIQKQMSTKNTQLNPTEPNITKPNPTQLNSTQWLSHWSNPTLYKPSLAITLNMYFICFYTYHYIVRVRKVSMKTTFFNLWKTVFPPSCFWHKYQHFLKYAGFPSIQTVLIMGKYRPSTELIFVRKRPFTDPNLHLIQGSTFGGHLIVVFNTALA